MAANLDPTLELWIARFRGPLIGLLASWGEDWRSAEELAMDTFAEAWLSRRRLRGDASDTAVVGPWLRGIAHNLSRHGRRRRARQRLEALPAELPAPVDTPDDRIEILRRGFAELRPEDQTVLRMFYLDESSTREVAALLELTEKAVESRLYQARRALRALTDRMSSPTAGGAR
ncbi:MAG: sigma-70 family RNA polymerase sigma factor [bacterium]|nr:sigma-70 family RNA polymerase sigma factor [bacterium]